MRATMIFTALWLATLPALAQEMPAECVALAQRFATEHPTDLGQCEPPQDIAYSVAECPRPDASEVTRPSSHLILAIDASGSMAGRIGGRTKMEIARDAGFDFLNEADPDTRVGLMVFGHEGNNQEDGKSVSCASAAMLHPFDARRATLAEGIARLDATGWTPIATALDRAGAIAAEVREGKGGLAPAPTIYLISDGEETCGGDPVAAARTLQSHDIPVVVHTIGFDVDDAAERQLRAIAEAGGGRYHAARDGAALNERLRALHEAEAQMARYRHCVLLNTARVLAPHQNAIQEMTGCFARNDATRRQVAIIHAMNRAKAAGEPEAACADALMSAAMSEVSGQRGWLTSRRDILRSMADTRLRAYLETTGLPLPD